MVTVEFDSMGEAVRLALVADEYVGGGLAVLILDATDPRSDGYMAEWGMLTASVPAAAEWCRGRGNIAIDADAPAALLEALEAAGILRMAGRSAASGMARYPLATVAEHALGGMGGLSETLEEALGSTVVVEYESGGDGGAFEVGTAPAGSAELERIIAAARSEADALAMMRSIATPFSLITFFRKAMAYLWASSSCRSASAFRSLIPSSTESGSDSSAPSFGFTALPFTLLTDLFGIQVEQMSDDLVFVAIKVDAIRRFNCCIKLRMRFHEIRKEKLVVWVVHVGES